MLKYLLMCRAAGNVTTGVERVLGEVRGGRSAAVVASSDASERTLKQLRDKCAFYGVPCIKSAETSAELSELLGTNGAVAAFSVAKGGTTHGCAKIIRSAIQEEIQNGKEDMRIRKDDR